MPELKADHWGARIWGLLSSLTLAQSLLEALLFSWFFALKLLV